jgi:pSer/pThr/pTyr-binding forkhead associated (FHA) protein
LGIAKKEPESKFKYFLVPQDKPTEKLFLTKTSTVLGRDKTSDMVIDNYDVSRRHCLLDIQARGVFILDLDSTNGTFVNGILVRDGYLNPGDRIELGPCVFVVNREAIDPDE